MAVVSSRLVFLSAICILIAPAIFQPLLNQKLNYFCSDKQGNYGSGSTYKANLNLVLSRPLSSNSTDIDNGFYNSSYGESPDKVYAIGLCRGDFKSDVCRNCFADSKDSLTESCPNEKEAIVWFDECMLRYSSRNILSSMDDTLEFPWMSDYYRVSDDETVQFSKDLRNFLQNLSGRAAAGGSLRKFAVGNAAAPRSQTIYGLVQCTPDLSEQDCSRCLSGAIDNFLKSYTDRLGGRILRPSCNFRYENSSFFDSTAYAPPPPQPPTLLPSPPTPSPPTLLASPPTRSPLTLPPPTTPPPLSLPPPKMTPLLPPPPPPPPQPPPPPPRRSSKSQTVIILVVAPVVAFVSFVVLAISIYINLRVRKRREKPRIQSNSTTRRTSASMVAPTLPLSSKFRWDVFLSFRGADTRKNFIGHLYSSLERVGIRIFRDEEELPRGETISTALLNAIEESRIFIVVFSKDFASSRWCLDELVEIVDRRKTIGRTLLPIFYHIKPSDVRRQTGTFTEAFARHEEQFHNNIERVHKWKKALTEAANCSGLDLESIANGHEAKFIEKIVEDVLRILKVSDDLNVAHIQ